MDGEIRETFRSETEISFEWKIREISLLSKGWKYSYRSAKIVLLDSEWFLEIFTGGISSDPESISLSLESRTVKRAHLEKPVRITLGIKKADGTEKKMVNDERLPEYQRYYCVDGFLERSDLLNRKSQLDPSDILTVTCTIRSDEPPSVEGETLASREKDTKVVSEISEVPLLHQEKVSVKAKLMVSRETQTESAPDTGSRAAQLEDLDTKGICTLREHLKDLLLDGDDHDVTFKVESQEFRAHRNMLRARSPVFAAMFKHGMKESTDDPIEIVDCSPEAFGEFLRYVYTGKVENFSPNIAVGLYYAGDKYDISGLKEVCVEFLKISLSTTAVCDVIILATRYGEEELFDRAMAFFTEHLEEIMITVEWQRFHVENPVQANEMCLKAVKNIRSNKN